MPAVAPRRTGVLAHWDFGTSRAAKFIQSFRLSPASCGSSLKALSGAVKASVLEWLRTDQFSLTRSTEAAGRVLLLRYGLDLSKPVWTILRPCQHSQWKDFLWNCTFCAWICPNHVQILGAPVNQSSTTFPSVVLAARKRCVKVQTSKIHSCLLLGLLNFYEQCRGNGGFFGPVRICKSAGPVPDASSL